LQRQKTTLNFAAIVRFILVSFIVLLWASVSKADWNVVMCDNRRYVPIEDVATFYKMNLPVSFGERFRLAAPGRSIEGVANGRDVYINGVKYVLCFPIVSKDGRTLISAMDVVKIIEPILRPQKIKNPGTVKTVILDAGHGGLDSGATGPLGREKDAALDVALRAKKLLQENGYQVRTTRLSDVFIPLDVRTKFANRYSNAIFLSIHFNKSKTGGASGLETYCLAPRGVPSMDEENLSYSDYVQHPGHRNDPANVALATTVHAALVRNLGLTDRGVKRARFVVVRNIKIPGILIEGGFMSGTPDAQLIARPEYRQRIAECILDGVNRYKQAVTEQAPYQKPSAVVAATDPTSVPNLEKVASLAGSRIGIESSVAQTQEAIESSVAQTREATESSVEKTEGPCCLQRLAWREQTPGEAEVLAGPFQPAQAQADRRNSINNSFTRWGSSCCSQWVALGKYVSLPSVQYCKLSSASSATRAASFLPQRIWVGTRTCGSANFGVNQNNARYQLSIAVMAPECDHASACRARSSAANVPGWLLKTSDCLPSQKPFAEIKNSGSHGI
jgi:N-acetylmuramoyl-L-alanine amidase